MPADPHRRSPLGALVVLAVLTAGGCSLESPPLELTFRESLIGAGKILRIHNTSNRELRDLRVRIVAPSGEERSYVLERLASFQGFELGWKKLGGWQVPAGAEVTIRCRGYLRTFSSRLPDD